MIVIRASKPRLLAYSVLAGAAVAAPVISSAAIGTTLYWLAPVIQLFLYVSILLSVDLGAFFKRASAAFGLWVVFLGADLALRYLHNSDDMDPTYVMMSAAWMAFIVIAAKLALALERRSVVNALPALSLIVLAFCLGIWSFFGCGDGICVQPLLGFWPPIIALLFGPGFTVMAW